MIYVLSFKFKLGLLFFIAFTFFASSEQGFAMQRAADGPLDDPRSPKRVRSDAFQSAFQRITLADIQELIVKAKKNDPVSQNCLMEIYYSKLYQEVMKPGMIDFSAWNNGKIEEMICQNDVYAFYFLRHYTELIERINLTPKDFLELTQNRVAEQNVYAQFNLARIYEQGLCGVDKNEEEARYLYEAAANKGFARAQFNFGSMYENGRGGLLKNDQNAICLFEYAADQGDVGALHQLGWLYERGLCGLPQNDIEAVGFYRLAADQGYALSQNNLGVMHRDGRGGLPQNHPEAARLFKLAVAQGEGYAQSNLGLMYEDGLGGLPQDHKEAVRLYKLSEKQGVSNAQRYLGVMYQYGRGIRKNPVEALRLYLKSNTDDAKSRIPFLLTYQSPAQNHETKSVEELGAEITKDIGSLVYTPLIIMPENAVVDGKVSSLPYLRQAMEKQLFEHIQNLKAGCLMIGFFPTDELINCNCQNIKPIFISRKGLSMKWGKLTTIGEENVSLVNNLLAYLEKYSDAAESLNVLRENNTKNLAKLMGNQLVRTSVEEFTRLSEEVKESEKELKKIREERICFERLDENIKNLIFHGAHQRTQEFLEDERYSFWKK